MRAGKEQNGIMSTLREIKISEAEYIKINGRTTDCLEPLTLFWTASGFELNAKGSELWVELEAGYDLFEPWFSVLINGAHVSKQMAVKGESKICLFRGRNPEEVKHVKFVKDVQAMNEDPENFLQVKGFLFDGEFLPVEEKPYKIEFIGDSITSGEGTYGAKKEIDWVSMFFSGVQNYAAYTAEAVNAEFRCISESGWGVLCSWQGEPEFALPKYYEKVCGILTGEHNRQLGANEVYDFTKWQPDVIVINLGTNDGSAFSMENCPYKIEEFEHAAVDFLKKVRKYNPKAEIVWVYGMLGYVMSMPIMRAMDTYSKETGDRKVHFLQLPAATAETVGAREHPGVENHKIAAGVLSEYLKKEILK